MSSSTPSTRIDWTAVPVQHIQLPRCPECGSLKYDSQRSSDNGDGSRTRPTICRECGTPWLVIAEPFGQDAEPDHLALAAEVAKRAREIRKGHFQDMESGRGECG